ncbi:hypothetical protein CcaverHIS002_0701480 [Cutaneotrichosporon cavernicola]|uniref:non-specific serine/threonine protein kinase n=1 Tax=Cutaneotrichosporon cavernicola TaxID=279322 RepID=A0AA48L9P2_9TREE|nr:uncharacterized protein CcaverHIS019_0701510 [Cutaneotrichosporon cavernicola]BEI86802.1 hypothetical protein CcaverHIS002_0701480 [Cutaneotrichosporon cavernicola]BEI94579.1 hypothetical protein CcaverHIS019_0701510 [Cutaneotrichosporon cavernicola]BEJ02356.1 hypothetical protein CcaverHIS631_0701510 [Cutaneotrichosporon cavernicola]
MFQRVLKAAGNQSSQAPPSPSSKTDMPPPTPPKSRSGTKENTAPGDRDRASYLSFLWQDKQGQGQMPARDEDVHMHTMKGAPPSPSKAQAPASPAKPYHYVKPAQQKLLAVPGAGQDIHMRTAKETTKEKVLEPWERELLAKDEIKRSATVAQIYFLDYYFDLLGYIADRRKRTEMFKADTEMRGVAGEAFKKEYASYSGRERVLLRKRRTKTRMDSFHIIAQVGQGGYGSVYLARKRDTGEVCALKKMRKGTLAKMDEVKHVLVERDILTAVKTPWLVRLLYAFQDREHVYLAMEFVPGGDFRTLLNNSGVLKEEHARFYAAEMFMGVNELHKLGYIHRDLKPENFLVDGTGHVKLTDFGLATGALNPAKIEEMKSKLDQVSDDNLVFRSTLERRTIYRSMRMAEPRYADSVVGSPDYMPPEVLRGKTYSFSADYWSLGCILFEFLCGFPPFSGSSPEETWANLKNWTRVLRRPVYDRPEDLIFNLSDVAWDGVCRLIAAPRDRVQSLADVAALPFFAPLPFAHLRETNAPFVPVLDGDTDVGYFDSFSSPEDMAKYAEVFKKQRSVEAVEEKGMGDRKNWVGFTFGPKAGLPPNGRMRNPDDPLAVMF